MGKKERTYKTAVRHEANVGVKDGLAPNKIAVIPLTVADASPGPIFQICDSIGWFFLNYDSQPIVKNNS